MKLCSSLIRFIKGQSHMGLYSLTRRACEVISTILTDSSIRYFFRSLKIAIKSSSDMAVTMFKLISVAVSWLIGWQTWMWPETPGKWKTTQCGSPIPTCSHNQKRKCYKPNYMKPKYEVKQSTSHTLEMKSETNALKLLASSKPHIRTSVQTADTISWSPCQYLFATRSSAFFPLQQVSSVSNFLCSAWRLKGYTMCIKHISTHLQPMLDHKFSINKTRTMQIEPLK
jgi:hypothetical protein